MMIEPEGLFSGERLAACSDLAQLYWPRLYIGSNGFARLELSYSAIISKIFKNFQKTPEAKDLWAIFGEYEANFLAMLYEVNGVWWCQFATSQKYLPRYKTRRDEMSPAPPVEMLQKFDKGYLGWKASNSFSPQSFRKSEANFGNFLQERRGEELELEKELEKEKSIGLSPLSPSAPPEPTIRPEEFANAWNVNRGTLPKVDAFTEGRRKKVLARIKAGLTLDRFKEAVGCCRSKPFLCGENDRGWTATFDWLIANSENAEKAINNPYGGSRNGNHQTTKDERTGNNVLEILGRPRADSAGAGRHGDSPRRGGGEGLFEDDDAPTLEGILS